jgi:hypothetical protein
VLLLTESVWRCESCHSTPSSGFICIFAEDSVCANGAVPGASCGLGEVGMEGEAFPTDTMASMDAVKVDAYGDTRCVSFIVRVDTNERWCVCLACPCPI